MQRFGRSFDHCTAYFFDSDGTYTEGDQRHSLGFSLLHYQMVAAGFILFPLSFLLFGVVGVLMLLQVRDRWERMFDAAMRDRNNVIYKISFSDVTVFT
jgi:hypothetical protein